jgi:DNA mismatch endonuclease, patch repair protein
VRPLIERTFEIEATAAARLRSSCVSYRSRVAASAHGTTPATRVYVTTPGRSRNMAAIRRSNTRPEMVLRSALHRCGFRFRKDYPIRIDGVLIRPDVAFTKHRLAIFVDGCFWHSCPIHGRRPTANTGYWAPKLLRNIERDVQQNDALVSAGWRVLRFWEHESIESVLDAITLQLDSAR